MKQAVYGIVFSSDQTKVLLVQRRDLPVWVLPGGGLDAGESPEEGAIREIEEETGLRSEIIRKVALYEPVNKMTQLTHFFACKAVGGALKTSSESKSVAFFPLSALPKRLAPPFKHWIDDTLLNAPNTLHKPTEGVNYWILIKLLLQHPILVIGYFLTKIGIRFNAKD